MAFLRKKPKLILYFDPSLPKIDESMFEGNDRKQFLNHYRDAKEEVPTKMPKPRGSVEFLIFGAHGRASNKNFK